ncbi:MAG TPA: cyclophilin-like fold protein [Nitrosopumilaceae archaeon]|nr:cyclophilin-like fold protein [Nitrosopumilaceae archaeon]
MKYKIEVVIPKIDNIDIELDDSTSPNTVKKFVEQLPFTVRMNLWGEEIYTDKSPIKEKEENAKSVVELNDVAYWPTGKAICLFFGPTPIGNKDEIKPYSPVNVIGKIINPEKSILKKISDGLDASFQLKK